MACGIGNLYYKVIIFLIEKGGMLEQIATPK